MLSLREAVNVGLNSESDWNERMLVAGYHAGILPVPRLPYRIFRAAHLSQMALREQLACAIAPWLDPDDICDDDSRIEAYLS